MIREDRSSTTDLELVFPDRIITVPYAGFQGLATEPDDPLVLDAIRDWIHSQLDHRVKKNSLPQDDPDRATDPATESTFWEGGGGNPDIVYRPYIATVTWGGERYQYSFRVTENS